MISCVLDRGKNFSFYRHIHTVAGDQSSLYPMSIAPPVQIKWVKHKAAV
jgi:hypothetical protein